MNRWNEIGRQIGQATGEALRITAIDPVAGGCINEAVVLHSGQARYFVKYSRAEGLSMFQAELDGLRALRQAEALRVPAPLCLGTVANTAFLALEFIEMGPPSPQAQGRLGRALAALHRASQDQFGWHRDNTIGSTPQHNAPRRNWVTFLREQRLGFQLQLARRNGYPRLADEGAKLLAHLDTFFADHDCCPSLLHGDLWSGNMAATSGDEPVVFDPAVYFGDRETDIAMTQLFGGFSHDFYDAYQEAWPLAPGYEIRRTLYNLYHVLNHLNLFGGSYEAQAGQAIAQLLAEVR